MQMRWVMQAARNAVRLRRQMRGPMRPSWGLEFETWARFLHHYAKRSHLLPLDFQRRALASMPRPPLPSSVREEHVDAGGVPGRLFHLKGAGDRWIYYLHGGGYSIGSVDTHRMLIARLARAAGANAFAIDYRLAPEHPFPAAREDALTGWRWLLERGVDPARAVIAGESAGGGLTLSTSVALRDAGEPLPAGAAVLSPWADLTLTGASIDTNARYDYLARSVLEVYVRRYAPNPRDPGVSPARADLRGLPPLLIQAGEAEALFDDARMVAEQAERAGVRTTLQTFPDMIHVFQVFPSLPQTREAVKRFGAFVREVTPSEEARGAA